MAGDHESHRMQAELSAKLSRDFQTQQCAHTVNEERERLV